MFPPMSGKLVYIVYNLSWRPYCMITLPVPSFVFSSKPCFPKCPVPVLFCFLAHSINYFLYFFCCLLWPVVLVPAYICVSAKTVSNDRGCVTTWLSFVWYKNILLGTEMSEFFFHSVYVKNKIAYTHECCLS